MALVLRSRGFIHSFIHWPVALPAAAGKLCRGTFPTGGRFVESVKTVRLPIEMETRRKSRRRRPFGKKVAVESRTWTEGGGQCCPRKTFQRCREPPVLLIGRNWPHHPRSRRCNNSLSLSLYWPVVLHVCRHFAAVYFSANPRHHFLRRRRQRRPKRKNAMTRRFVPAAPMSRPATTR